MAFTWEYFHSECPSYFSVHSVWKVYFDIYGYISLLMTNAFRENTLTNPIPIQHNRFLGSNNMYSANRNWRRLWWYDCKISDHLKFSNSFGVVLCIILCDWRKIAFSRQFRDQNPLITVHSWHFVRIFQYIQYLVCEKLDQLKRLCMGWI